LWADNSAGVGVYSNGLWLWLPIPALDWAMLYSHDHHYDF